MDASRAVRNAALLGALLAGLLAPAPGRAQAPPSGRLVDRVVAVADEDPILASDLDRVIGLGLIERQAGESDDALRRRVLEGLIEQRLRAHEVDRFGFEQVPVEEIERQVEQIRARFPDEGAFAERLRQLGLDQDSLRQLVARQIAVLRYVEERLGPRVFVSLDDIRAYYESTLVPELQRRGEPVPPIEEVRERVRAVLREQKLNQELAKWTEELRREADVVNYLDDLPAELPPVVETIREPGGD